METRPIHPFNGDVEVVGQALIKATVDQHTTERFQPLPKAIAQNSEPLCALRCISQRTLQCFSQSHHKRQRNAAASQSTLLRTSMELRFQFNRWGHNQSANPLGAIELVAAEAEQINP